MKLLLENSRKIQMHSYKQGVISNEIKLTIEFSSFFLKKVSEECHVGISSTFFLSMGHFKINSTDIFKTIKLISYYKF